jgi:hypothetical protein
MATLEAPPPIASVGGVGCKHCKYWRLYTDETTRELLGVGDGCGKCTHPALCKLAMTKGESVLASHEREKVRVMRVPEVSVIVSTASTWVCPYFAMKDEDKKKRI